MGDSIEATCHVCGYVGAVNSGEGFFYCYQCNSQIEDMVDTALDDEDHGLYTGNLLRRRESTAIKLEPLSQTRPSSQFWGSLKSPVSNPVKVEDWPDGIGPDDPTDFGERSWPDKEEDYLRMSYVMGLQIMIQLQTKALVEEFNVSPLVCGLAGTVWLRYVASTGVFEGDWADEVIKESESQKEGFREDFKPKAKYSNESFNIHGQRTVTIWYRSLVKIIPVSHTLVIIYLVCHLAREAVLATDILRWSVEGKLPYFTAFLDIEKEFGTASTMCPLDCSSMFKPSESISLYKLESQAASIARKIGLELPPVNFYAIAARYLKTLALDSAKILPSVSQIYEWSMPPDLWLSASEMRVPTRVCVLSMMIVTIRILYNIHGFGYWEKSFSIDLATGESLDRRKYIAGASNAGSNKKKSTHIGKSELEAMSLLRHLEERYDELIETDDYSKDLLTYLQYCEDKVFAGMGPSYEDPEEEKLREQFGTYYRDKKCICPSKRSRDGEAINLNKESRNMRDSERLHNKSSHDDCSLQSMGIDDDCSPQSMSIDDDSSKQNTSADDFQTSNSFSNKYKAMKRLRLDMEENRFCYIPPRVRVKRLDYLQYARKKDEGAYTYVAHADYYILLRSCARVAKVDVRAMHSAVMSFERRLGWLEKRIDYCLSRLGPEEEFCERCREEM